MLRTYALSPKVLRRVLRRTFWRFQLIATLSFLVFGFYLTSFGRPVQWPVALPIISVIALAYILIIFFNYRQQLRQLYSIRVELDNSSITYRQLGEDPLRVMRADITAAREQKNGLLVETVDPSISLFIPTGLANDGDLDVRQTIEAWVGVETRPTTRPVENVRLLLGVIAGLYILLFANTLWVILPLGLLLLLYGIYTENRLVRASSPGTARTYNMAFSFLLFVVLMKSCLIGLVAIMVR